MRAEAKRRWDVNQRMVKQGPEAVSRADIAENRASPRVSVVIPVFNRAELIRPCLESLFAQTFPPDRFEIMLVDDGSTEEVGAIATACAAGWEGSFRLLQQANAGPASARNRGICSSAADIVAFMDADCVAAPDWLERLVAALDTAGADGVGGPIVNITPPSWVADYLACADFFRHRLRNGAVDYLLTANVVFRRAALVAVGGFCARRDVWAEDADLSFRLRRAGYRLSVTSEGAVTHHGAPLTVHSLMRDLYRYGRGNYLLSPGWGRRARPVELVRHAGALLLAPVLALRLTRQVGPWRALSFTPLIAIEHGAFVAGMLAAALEDVRVGWGRHRRAS